MESAAMGLSRCTGVAAPALAITGSLSTCRSGSNGISCRNPNFLPHSADGPPPGFPSQASFGALKLFADAAFELQNQKGGACPLPHELLQLVDPPEPCLICLTALHAKNKTIITVSDGICWCRVASTQLPPVPSFPDGRPGCPPDEEQLNFAAAELAGCLLRLSQLSITRTPRGKHIILCRAFHVLSRDCKTVALELQEQQRPEVIFPVWPEGAATAPSVQQPQQPLQQQCPADPPQPSCGQETSQQIRQVSQLAHHQQHMGASHPSQRGGSLQQSAATIYQQFMPQQQHLQQQQLPHDKRLLTGQQQRERPYPNHHEESQQHQQPVHPADLQRRPPQQQLGQQQRMPEQQLQEQHRLRGEGSVPATGLQRQQSPQRYRSWQEEAAQQQRGIRDERPHRPEQPPPQAYGSRVEQHAAPSHKQDQQQQPRQQQMHDGRPYGHLDHVEGSSAAASGPQRQPGVLSTYRSVPYQPSRPQGVQQQRAQHGVRTSVGGESFIPIEDLTAYVAKWTIRARVDVKGDIRKYNNARGPGQLFNVELKDKSGEIRATFFNAAVDRWYNLLQEGKVYYFRGGAVKAKNPRFNTTRHNYEITFDEKSSILETQDEGDIPSFSSDMVDIKKIDAMEEMNATVSIAAIVHDYRPMQSITIKATGQPKPKRDVFLVDENGLSICLTLWGEKAKEISEEQLSQRPVILFKNVKVGDWNGKKLDSQSSTRIEFFPNNDRTAALQEWWTREGCAHPAFQMVSSGSGAAVGRKEVLKTLEQVVREAVQADPSVIADKGVYFSCAALLERVSDERFSWPACPECRKKMVETVAHIWSCANCGRHFEHPNHTYMLNIMLMDTTGSLRCTCMGEKAEEIMGFVKAETLLLLQDHQSLDEQGRSFNDVFADVNLEEWIFRVCVKSDTYMDEMRLKHRVVAAVPLFRRVGDQTRHRISFIRNTFAQFDIPCP